MLENQYSKTNPIGAKRKKNDISNIRHLRASGWLQRELAVKFNVDASHINKILNNRKWKHV